MIDSEKPDQQNPQTSQREPIISTSQEADPAEVAWWMAQISRGADPDKTPYPKPRGNSK